MSIYYVDYSAGVDGQSGLSEGQAWKTINKVNTSMGSFSPNDFILFQGGDTWPNSDSDLAITCQGTSGNQITFGSYGSGRPRFAENRISCGSGNGYISLDNIEVASAAGGNGVDFYKSGGWHYDIFLTNMLVYDAANVGIFLQSIDGYLIDGCECYSCYNGNIYVYGSNYPITNGTISNCESYNATQNDGISVHEGDSQEPCGSNHLIRDCLCYGNAEEGFDVSDGSEVTVQDCEAYGDAYAGYIFEGQNNVTVNRCIARNGNHGMHIGGSNVTIQNCLIYDNGYNGIIMQPYTSVSGINLYNNTLVHPDSGNSGTLIEIDPNASSMNIKNNIIMTKQATYPSRLIIFYSGLTPTNTGTVMDNNCYYHGGGDSGRFFADDSAYSFSTWQSTFSHEASSIFSDPKFVDQANDNYRLQVDSPCKNTGANVGVSDDFYKTVRPQGGGYEIGAVEFPESVTQGKPVYEAFNVQVEE